MHRLHEHTRLLYAKELGILSLQYSRSTKVNLNPPLKGYLTVRRALGELNNKSNSSSSIRRKTAIFINVQDTDGEDPRKRGLTPGLYPLLVIDTGFELRQFGFQTVPILNITLDVL